MDISFGEAVDLAWAHGGGLGWSATRGVLLWGLAGFAAIAVIYLGCRRARWLEVSDQSRWPHLALAVVLIFAVWPAIAAAGIVTGARDAVTGSLQHELSRPGMSEAIGAVLVAPLVVIEASDVRDVDELWTRDVSFLLDDGRRLELSARASAEITRALLAHSASASESEIWRWLNRVAIERFVAELMKKAQRYLALFSPLQGDASGALSFRSASLQVGQNFTNRELLPRVAAPFNKTRGAVLGSAAAVVIVFLLTVWLIRRRQPKARSRSS